MKMPKLVNVLQSGLRRSERIQKFKNSKEAEESHAKNRNAFTAKKLIAFYTVISTVFNQFTSRVMDPKPDATTYDKSINRFHEANELYDGTLNQINLSVLARSFNEKYTYLQSMQQNVSLLTQWWLSWWRTNSVTT